MFTITTLFTLHDLEQAVRLARTNYVDLINKYVKAFGPTSSLCMLQVEEEVRAYLNSALNGQPGLSAGAVFAKDSNTHEVVGFAIYLEGANSADCGLNYMVVDKHYRRQGVMKAMLANIMGRFTSIGLSCNVDKVPYYESLNFWVTGSDVVQVFMNWGTKPQGSLPTIDFSKNQRLSEAIETFKRIEGKRADKVLSRLGERQEELVKYVQRYANNRIAGLSHINSI